MAATSASYTGGLPFAEVYDQKFRAASLLEQADDAGARAFELLVLTTASVLDLGSARNTQAHARRDVLDSADGATCESMRSAARPLYVAAMRVNGYLLSERPVWPHPTLEEVQEGAELFAKAAGKYYEANKLAKDPASKVQSCICGFIVLSWSMTACPLQCWDPEGAGFTEAMLLECMDLYTS